ncbi:MAG: preprotein translocase subunit YajC [Actinobacteria bacterium]|nr:preprotein translocase subunit YajC [Actinomycetota bacterium]
MAFFLPLVLLALMWVLLVRPQQQRVRRQRELIASLEVGDEVITAGGMVGRVTAIEGEEIRLEVAPGVTIRFVRLAVSSRVEQPDETVDVDVDDVEHEPEALEEGKEDT